MQVFKKESVDDIGVALSAVLLIVTIGQKKTAKGVKRTKRVYDNA